VLYRYILKIEVISTLSVGNAGDMENKLAVYYPDVTRQNIMDALIEHCDMQIPPVTSARWLSAIVYLYSSVSDGVALNISRKTLKAREKKKVRQLSLSLKAVSRGMSEGESRLLNHDSFRPLPPHLAGVLL
jgi:hypothetical protein